MLDHRFEALPIGEVGKLFGEKFATTLGGLSLDQWQGPVESAYGMLRCCKGEVLQLRARLSGRPSIGPANDRLGDRPNPFVEIEFAPLGVECR
jgi:hypothetical protein